MAKPDLPLAQAPAEIVADEHVPYLAAMRYKDSGLRNREQWEHVWALQREEDRTGERLDIPVPPKYSPLTSSRRPTGRTEASWTSSTDFA